MFFGKATIYSNDGGESSGSETQQTGSMDNLYDSLGETNQTAQAAYQRAASAESMLNRMRDVFAPPPAQDPNAISDEWYDRVLEAGLEAEKAGKGMPITIQLANQLRQAQEQQRIQQQEIAKLKSQQEVSKNPEYIADVQTFNSMDAEIQQKITAIYGEFKPELWGAITQSVAAEVKRLQKESPNDWKQVRNSKQHQTSMINHFMKEFVPPAAMNLMKEVNDANKVLSAKQILAGINEARAELRNAQDPADIAQLQNVIERGRQYFWEVKMSEQTKGGRR